MKTLPAIRPAAHSHRTLWRAHARYTAPATTARLPANSAAAPINRAPVEFCFPKEGVSGSEAEPKEAAEAGRDKTRQFDQHEPNHGNGTSSVSCPFGHRFRPDSLSDADADG